MDISSLRNSPRVVAPVVLAVFAIALLIVFVSSGGGSTPQSPSKTALEKQRDLGLGRFGAAAQPGASGAATPVGYAVKPGDTLAGIAQKTGVSVARLQQLNPSIDPQALVAGQKLNLR